MKHIVQTENLTKYYDPVHAVDGISLSVRKGEIYGFLGLNGAGKTTTIRMLLGMIQPTSGAAFLYGQRVHAGNHELWRRVGYLVEIPDAYPELTVRENLEINRRLHRIASKGIVDATIDKLKLTEYRDRKARELSLGNAQRLGLAKALLHDPDILILDEPSNGLDPAGIVEIRELLRDLAFKRGVTVFISSHILGEISRLATRIGIIHKGQLIQEVNTDQLEHLRRKRLLVGTLDQAAAKARLSAKHYPCQSARDGSLEITAATAIEHPERVSALLAQGGLAPTLLNVEEEDLESYFLRMVDSNGDGK